MFVGGLGFVTEEKMRLTNKRWNQSLFLFVSLAVKFHVTKNYQAVVFIFLDLGVELGGTWRVFCLYQCNSTTRKVWFWKYTWQYSLCIFVGSQYCICVKLGCTLLRLATEPWFSKIIVITAWGVMVPVLS